MELRSGTVVAPSPQKQTQTQTQSQSQSESRPLLSAEGLGMFHRGVGLLLSRWTALQLAIHNCWGGSSSHIKAQQLHDDVVSWMAQPKVRYIDELEDMLDENLVVLFNTETEDGSLEEVAEKVMLLYEDCLDGNFQTIHELMSSTNTASHSASRSQQVENEEENDVPSAALLGEIFGEKNADAMETDDSEHNAISETTRDNESPMLEDGWQLVSSKTKRKPRRT